MPSTTETDVIGILLRVTNLSIIALTKTVAVVDVKRQSGGFVRSDRHHSRAFLTKASVYKRPDKSAERSCN